MNKNSLHFIVPFYVSVDEVLLIHYGGRRYCNVIGAVVLKVVNGALLVSEVTRQLINAIESN